VLLLFAVVSVDRGPGAARRTGRDPDSVVVAPPDPKPHVWTLAWRGIKNVAHRIWEGVSMYIFVV